jgi:hypothetical protein
MLCHPTEANQFKWASIFFQAVSLVAKDINSLPVYNNSTDPEDELGPEISMINYFIRCITSPNATSENATTSLEHKISFAALDKLVNTIHQMLLAFSVLKACCKMHRNEQTLARYSTQWSKLPTEHVSRPHYALLASFFVAGVRGLLLTIHDKTVFSASKCFLLTSIVAKVNALQPAPDDQILEPVWKRTNAYICSIINQAFFTSDGFTPVRISRYDLAKYIVLDFGDHWLNSHPRGEHILEVPKRSDCPLATIQNV